MERFDMQNPIRWFEIYVEDMKRAKTFYQGVFQLALTQIDAEQKDLEMWGFPADMDKYGSTGTLVKMEGIKPGGGGTLVYFGSDDCAVEEARVEKSGGQVHKPKTSIGPHGFITLAVDTEGNMFGIHSMQ